MRFQGRITEWRDEQGFGFITPNGGGERVFLHIKAFKSRARRPPGDELVNFILVRDDKGRPRAEQAEFVSLRRQPASGNGSSPFRPLFASVYLIIVGVLTFAAKIPAVVLFAYLGLSILTYIFYAADKSAAVKGRWRTPENTLQFLALLGGWPGGLFAQQFLRHKSRKPSFQFIFWAAVVINIVAFGWLLSADGAVYRFAHR